MRPWPGLFSGAAGLKPDQSARVPCCSSRGVQGEGRFRGERRGRQQGTCLCLCRQVRVQTYMWTCTWVGVDSELGVNGSVSAGCVQPPPEVRKLRYKGSLQLAGL